MGLTEHQMVTCPMLYTGTGYALMIEEPYTRRVKLVSLARHSLGVTIGRFSYDTFADVVSYMGWSIIPGEVWLLEDEATRGYLLDIKTR